MLRRSTFGRRMQRTLVTGVITCLLSAAAAVPAAHAGNPDSDNSVRLSPGDQWTLGKTGSGETKAGTQKAGQAAPDSGWAWICQGSFADPDLTSVGGFTWGAVQHCTSSLPQQVSVKINLCVQDPGGPSHFHCDVYKGGKKGDLVHAYTTRTDARVSGCSRSKTSTYVQVAYSIMADYEYYPEPVESNQTSIKCGF